MICDNYEWVLLMFMILTDEFYTQKRNLNSIIKDL